MSIQMLMKKHTPRRNEKITSMKDRLEETPMKKNFLSKLLIAGGMMLAITSTALATGAEITYDKNDVTPPWGKIIIQGAEENDTYYVESQDVTVQIYARDDISDTVYYHLSTSPISTTTKITDWNLYNDGATENINLPSLTSTNTIYAAFKDKNGNTSIIYDDSLSHTIIYDVNAGGDTTAEGVTGVDTIVAYGESFVVTMQRPKWEGKYFLGWSTKADVTTASYEPGDIIVYNELAGLGDTITLYAIWADSLPLLSSVAKIGDYVNYPVPYDNVVTFTDSSATSYTSTNKGWRVIGIEDDGTVNLVSAGVPLTFYNYTSTNTSLPALTTNFLTTAFGTETQVATYRKSGFGPYTTLAEVFTNKYTATEEETSLPKVRSMTQEDIFGATGKTAMGIDYEMGLDNEKYGRLFKVGAFYWIAFPEFSGANRMWNVRDDGRVYYNFEQEFGVRPVVSLKPDVRAAGKDLTDAWDITIESEEEETGECTITFDAYYQEGTLLQENFMAPVTIARGSQYTIPTGISFKSYAVIFHTPEFKINGETFYEGDVITITEDTIIDITFTEDDLIEGEIPIN